MTKNIIKILANNIEYFFYENDINISCIENHTLKLKDIYNKVLHTQNISKIKKTANQNYLAISNFILADPSNNTFDWIKITGITTYGAIHDDPVKGTIKYNKYDVEHNKIQNGFLSTKGTADITRRKNNLKKLCAGGDGTYNYPITAALGDTNAIKNSDYHNYNPTIDVSGGLHSAEYEAGNIFYIPYLRKYFIIEDTTDPAHANQIDLWLGPPNHSNLIPEASLSILNHKVDYSGTVGQLSQCSTIDIFGKRYGLKHEPNISYNCDNITPLQTKEINFYYNYITSMSAFPLAGCAGADTKAHDNYSCSKGQTPSTPPGTCICIPTKKDQIDNHLTDPRNYIWALRNPPSNLEVIPGNFMDYGNRLITDENNPGSKINVKDKCADLNNMNKDWDLPWNPNTGSFCGNYSGHPFTEEASPKGCYGVGDNSTQLIYEF